MFNKKKKEEKLKENIKKEVLKELKKEKEQVQDNVQILEVPEITMREHSKEETYAIRKSFLSIFLFALIALFVLVVIFILNPFKMPETEKENKEEEQIKEEIKKDTLLTMEDGIINNSNEELIEMFYMIKPKNNEYYLYDSTYLYSKDEFLVSEINEEYLLYLMTKSEMFKDKINEEFGETKAELCNKDAYIKISVSDIDNMISSLFIVNSLKQYPNFTYAHYFDDVYSANIKFVYSDGYYVSFCQKDEENLKYDKIAMPMVEDAKKEKGYIYLSVRVAFSTKEKVYADYNLTKVLSNNIDSDMLSYIKSADKYQFVFKEDNGKYKLEKNVKIKQDLS